MLTDPAVLIAEFSAGAGALSMDGWPCTLHGELLSAPHRQAALRPGSGAVYAFALSARTTSAAGADEASVKPWMLSNHDRLHIYVPAGAL
jgi:hypothetical protein